VVVGPLLVPGSAGPVLPSDPRKGRTQRGVKYKAKVETYGGSSGSRRRAPEHREPRLASPGSPGEPAGAENRSAGTWVGVAVMPRRYRQWPPGARAHSRRGVEPEAGMRVWSSNDMSTVGLGDMSTWRQDAMWSKQLVDSPREQGEPTATWRDKAICSHIDKSMSGPQLVDLSRIGAGRQGPLLARRRSGGANPKSGGTG